MLRVLLPPLTHMLAQAYTQAQDLPTHTSDKNTPANTFNVVQLAGELLIVRQTVSVGIRNTLLFAVGRPSQKHTLVPLLCLSWTLNENIVDDRAQVTLPPV